LEHITELRQRLLRAAIALVIGAFIGSIFTRPAVELLVRPTQTADIVVLSPTEGPITYFRVSLFLGVIFALPFITYQIYAFIRPGLYPRERRFMRLSIPLVLLLFLLGTAFGLFVLVPLSLPVLSGFFSGIVDPMYSLNEYLGFVTAILLWMGLLFQTPLVIYVLAVFGFVEPRGLKKVRKYVIFGAGFLAAVITPTTDPVTMLLAMAPFVVLYEVGILLAGLAARRRDKDNTSQGASS
jgi:sec-independent protein translocase protein TatC